MQNRTYHHIITSLILFAFLVVRVADAHAFSHFANNDDESCDLCEFIVTSEKQVLLINLFINNVNPKPEALYEESILVKKYSTPNYAVNQPLKICNKPPPLS